MTARDVQESLFADGQARPVGRIVGSVFTGTNAELIAAIAPLYLTGTILDPTYGGGRWWTKYTPPLLSASDLTTGVDFRALPHADRSFDAVVFDPPYVPQGGDKTRGENLDGFRDRYGLERRNRSDLLDLISGGVTECARVTDRWLLVKCTDFVHGRQFILGHVFVINLAEELGLTCHDLIVHFTGPGPGARIDTVLRARRAHSYLLVFRRPRSRSRGPEVTP